MQQPEQQRECPQGGTPSRLHPVPPVRRADRPVPPVRRAYLRARAAHASQHVSHPHQFCHFYLFKHILTVTLFVQPRVVYHHWASHVMAHCCFDSFNIFVSSTLFSILRSVQTASGFASLSGNNKTGVNNEGKHNNNTRWFLYRNGVKEMYEFNALSHKIIC